MRAWRATTKHCGVCVKEGRHLKGPKPKQTRLALQRDMRSPLRRAIESDDRGEIAGELVARVAKQPDGCWIWQGRVKDGYGVVRVGGRDLSAHRLMAHVCFGASAAPVVHHACANRRCISPMHLSYVTQFENNAEMLARTHFLERIAALESALRAVAPNHPLVTLGGTPKAKEVPLRSA